MPVTNKRHFIQYIAQNGMRYMYNNTLITLTWHLNTYVVVSDRICSTVCLKFKHHVMMLETSIMTDTCIHQLKSNFPLLSHLPTSENRSYITVFWITGVVIVAFDSGIEWLIVKGIANHADSSSTQQNAKRWRCFAGVMAASLVMHILSNPTVFRSLSHYKSNFDKPKF